MNPELNIKFLSSALISDPAQVVSIIERWPASDVAEFLGKISSPSAVCLLENIHPNLAAKVLGFFDARQRGQYLGGVKALTGALIIKCMSEELAEDTFQEMKGKKIAYIKKQISYSNDTVGMWMKYDCSKVYDNYTISDIKASSDFVMADHLLPIIYVVTRENKLRGYISAKSILTADNNREAGSLCQKAQSFLSPHSTLASISNHPGWLNQDVLPVLDKDGSLLGALMHRDMRAGLQYNAPGHVHEYSAPNTSYGLYGDTLISLLRN